MWMLRAAKLDDAGYDSAQVQRAYSVRQRHVLIRLQPVDGQQNAAQTGGAVLELLSETWQPGRRRSQ